MAIPNPTPPGWIDRSDRWMKMTTTIDMGAVEHMLTEQMPVVFRDHLYTYIRQVTASIIENAKGQLYPHHGVRTGLMKATLDAFLVDAAFESLQAVMFDLESHDAPYWVFVEFGHLRDDGSWWPGYHFLENAVKGREKDLNEAIQQAWHDTVAQLGGGRGDISVHSVVYAQGY